MILVTDKAWQKIEEKLSEGSFDSLRIKLNTKGCGGYSYIFEPTNNRVETDYHIDKGNYTVLISKEVYQLIDGSTIDWVQKDAFSFGFDVVLNQNEMGRCGCGQSVMFGLP